MSEKWKKVKFQWNDEIGNYCEISRKDKLIQPSFLLFLMFIFLIVTVQGASLSIRLAFFVLLKT